VGLIAKQNGQGDFPITPEGTYVGRCFKIIDIGTQTQTGMYGTNEQHKVMISWELLDDDVKMEDGRPFAISQFYTVSLHEKATLRKDLEAWRGKKFTDEELEGFDLKNVLGVYCMLQVVHSSDGKYANMNSIMGYKGEKPAPVNPNVVFDIDNPDMKLFESFSDNMKAKIMAAPEWNKRLDPQPTPATAPQEQPKDVVIDDFGDEPVNLDDIPF